MPRKSAKRNVKQKNTRQSAKTTFDSRKLEKELFQTPSKLATQLNKEIKMHKQKESKLKSAINKLKSQIKTTETRLKTASKNKDSSSGKKQFKTAKKTYDVALKAQSQLNKQFENTNSTLSSLTDRHSRLIALDKHLSQFEKDWNANNKKAKPIVAKPKKIKTASRNTAPVQKQTNELNFNNELSSSNRYTDKEEINSQVEKESELTS